MVENNFWINKNSETTYLRCFRAYGLVTRTGIEPMIPPWKGGVLTSWPTGRFFAMRNVVAVTGFEPVTPWVWTKCSSQLSYTAICVSHSDLIIIHYLCPVVNLFCIKNIDIFDFCFFVQYFRLLICENLSFCIIWLCRCGQYCIKEEYFTWILLKPL